METSWPGCMPVVPTHRLGVMECCQIYRMHKHQRLSLAGEAWLLDRPPEYQEKADMHRGRRRRTGELAIWTCLKVTSDIDWPTIWPVVLFWDSSHSSFEDMCRCVFLITKTIKASSIEQSNGNLDLHGDKAAAKTRATG